MIPRPTSAPGSSYFKLAVRPGSLVRAGSIELRNPTALPVRVIVAVVDGTTLSTLGSGYAPPGSPTHGPTRWLAIGPRTIALRPHASVALPVTVRIPRKAAPGDYLSGVSVEALDQRGQRRASKGVSIASVARYAIGVEVSVPGARLSLIRFTGVRLERQPAGLTFQLLARNLGNSILQGVHGHVLITREGHTVVSRAIPAGTFVTNSGISYPVTAFKQVPAQGTSYRVAAYIRYPGGIARLNTTVSFGGRQAMLQHLYGGIRPQTQRAASPGGRSPGSRSSASTPCSPQSCSCTDASESHGRPPEPQWLPVRTTAAVRAVRRPSSGRPFGVRPAR